MRKSFENSKIMEELNKKNKKVWLKLRGGGCVTIKSEEREEGRRRGDSEGKNQY